ncbi:MAG: prepilin-type cleavage/methylation domain-containing protein [Methylotenera sp.]
MFKQKISSNQSAQRGVVLIEAMIAILIFSMGMLAIVGLQAAMIKNTADSKFRADASYIAQQRIGTMWADPANAVNYLEASTDISALLPGGRRTVTQPTAGQFRVIVGWTEPGETPAASATTAPCFMLVAHCYTTIASIAGG